MGKNKVDEEINVFGFDLLRATKDITYNQNNSNQVGIEAFMIWQGHCCD